MAVLFSAISTSFRLSCQNVRQKPHRTLRRLRRNFLFVEKSSGAESPGRAGRASRQIPGTFKCPWRWAQDDNSDRVPRFLTKDVCPDCKHYCRAVLYSHRGLVQKCDVKTGEIVWKWILIELPVAFVFNAY